MSGSHTQQFPARKGLEGNEAIRQGKPVNELIRDWVARKADAILAAANGGQPARKAA
jgi:hypothetical protein